MALKDKQFPCLISAITLAGSGPTCLAADELLCCHQAIIGKNYSTKSYFRFQKLCINLLRFLNETVTNYSHVEINPYYPTFYTTFLFSWRISSLFDLTISHAIAFQWWGKNAFTWQCFKTNGTFAIIPQAIKRGGGGSFEFIVV